MYMCHMVADTLYELHVMARNIGVQRKWFQDQASSPHYDVCQSVRLHAIQLGAVEIDRHELGALIKAKREMWIREMTADV